MYFLYSHQQYIHGNFFSFWPCHVARDWTHSPCNGSSLHHWTTREVPEALFFLEWKSSSQLWTPLWVKTCLFPWGTLIVSLDFFFPLAKGNFSKFPRGQITQEGMTLTILHSKRRGSWGYMWLVCKPLLNPLVFWSSTPLLSLVLWIQGLSLLPPGGGLPVLERLWERQEPGCPHWWRGSGPATWNSFQGSSANFLTVLPAYTYLTFNFL